MDLKEAIDRIAELAIAGEQTEVIDLPARPGKAVKIIGGTREEFDTYVDTRNHIALTFDALTQYLADHGGDKGGHIWVNPEEILAVIGYPANPVSQRIALKLRATVQRAALVKAAGEYMSQEAFVAMLNGDLDGAFDGALEAQISNISFAETIGVKAKVDKRALGGDSGEITRFLTIQTGTGEAAKNLRRDWDWSGVVFQGIDAVQRVVKVSLDVKIKESTILFKLIPRELPEMIDGALAEVASMLRAMADAAPPERGRWTVCVGRPN